jgi:hypothetical protein
LSESAENLQRKVAINVATTPILIGNNEKPAENQQRKSCNNIATTLFE